MKDIKHAKKKKVALEKNIEELLQGFCKETGLKFGKVEITCLYDLEATIGTYTVKLNIKNPFN